MAKRLIALAISLAVGAWDCTKSRLRRFADRPAPISGVVLYYHAVKPHQRRRFARQMDELLKRACAFPAGSPEAMTEDRRNVAVTFDDGFESVVENAVPELVKRRIPFTVFVPSGCLGQRPPWVRRGRHAVCEERVLSASGLRTLANVPFATIGSHSVNHRNLAKVDSTSAEHELVGSRADLETAVGTRIDLFAFPHGAHNAALLDQARQAGYRRVFTVEPTMINSKADEFALGRVAADPDDWPIEFRLKIAGAYRWRHYLHRSRQAV